ncbi:glycerate kinase [Roseomonas fluvialis]|uniref:Glycerate kinase n=1 Tax=Roseomonas fluvialis TaxID=1750527 RepID=A0ABM7Y068_9PROT|nr:glycerate kinase [Roseomonas fluvialis]BDG71150.1 glycerate kinase [Roseomonas fluvialis]
MTPLKILVAPSGFKECLQADAVAEAIATGLGRACPAARITRRPVTDGGEGFARAIATGAGGHVEPVTVTGPVGRPVTAHIGWAGGALAGTAIIEMASAAGLRLVPRDMRDPLATSTRGVGELIRAALDRGARRLLIGCGDSGTNDAGAGMAQALGYRMLDAAGDELQPGGAALAWLERIDATGRDRRLDGLPVMVACNTRVMLTGSDGVARRFGPQKGASPEAVRRLEAGLATFAAVAARDLGVRGLPALPGAGASGGLGAGLHALLGARLRPWQEVVLDGLALDREIAAANLVVTAEGGIDEQTVQGKVPGIVAVRARAHGVPVIALAGSVGAGYEAVHAAGIDAVASTLGQAVPLDEAIARAPADIARTAEQAMRTVMVGMSMAGRCRDSQSRCAA